MVTCDVAGPRPAAEFDDAKAVRLICFGMCVANVVFIVATFMQGSWLLDSSGRGVPADFVDVWAAGRLALEGHAAAAYDWTIHRQGEVAALGRDFDGYFPWNYPPFFLFVAALFALLPYAVAFATWSLLTLPAYLMAIRQIIGRRIGLLLACAFPALVPNFVVGQNGFVTAALLGAALAVMPRRPVLAGCLLGLMTYKPQFGILFPLVLIAGGEWRTFWSAVFVAALLAASSVVAFGIEPWQGFFHSLGMVNQTVLGHGDGDFNKLQSIFGLARSLGASERLAWSLQIALGVLSAALLWPMWRSRRPFDLKAAAASVAALLATPYIYVYDLVALAVPIAFLVRASRCSGFASHEIAGIAGATLLVLSFPFVKVPVGFVAIAIIATLIVRRITAAETAG